MMTRSLASTLAVLAMSGCAGRSVSDVDRAVVDGGSSEGEGAGTGEGEGNEGEGVGEGEGAGEGEGEGEGAGRGPFSADLPSDWLETVDAFERACPFAPPYGPSVFAIEEMSSPSQVDQKLSARDAAWRDAFANGHAHFDLGKESMCFELIATSTAHQCVDSDVARRFCEQEIVAIDANEPCLYNSLCPSGQCQCGLPDNQCTPFGNGSDCTADAFCPAGEACGFSQRCGPAQPLGASCNSPIADQCAPGLGCFGTNIGATCEPLQGEGGACANLIAPLNPTCQLPFVCVNNRCGLGVGRGEVCNDTRVCAPGLLCGSAVGGEQRCIRQGLLGDSCDGDTLLCEPGRACVDGLCSASPAGASCAQTNECAAPLVCTPGHQCAATLAAGSSCTVDDVCAPPATCRSGVCAMAGAGDACVFRSDCGPGLGCSAQICTPSSAGDACQDDNQCSAALFCFSNVCSGLPEAGESCSFRGCADDAYCDANNICQAVARLGEACSINTCASGLQCDLTQGGGTCIALVAGGASCASGEECAPGFQCWPPEGFLAGDLRCMHLDNDREPCDESHQCLGRCINGFCADEHFGNDNHVSVVGDLCGFCDVYRNGLACDTATNLCRAPVVVDEGPCDAVHVCRNGLTTRVCDAVDHVCKDVPNPQPSCPGDTCCVSP